MAVYTPLFVYLSPASIPQVVANIQKYLADNPIISDDETIETLIREYIEAHPELMAVSSVNGKTGTVVLTGSDININASSAVSIETQLSNLASMIQSASGDITQIESQLETIYTNIGTIETNVSNNTTAISALQTSVEGHGTRLSTAESDIDALESSQTAQGTRLTTAEGNINSLKTRMTQAESDIDSNEAAIGTNQTAIQTINNSFINETNASYYQGRVDQGNLSYYSINECVFMRGLFRISDSGNVGAGLAIFTGLPRPRGGGCATLVGTADGATTVIHCYVNTSGSLITCQALTASTWYNISGFYNA